MALTKRARDKGTQAAAKLLPSGTHIRAYAVGRGHARLAPGAIIAGAVFAAAFIVGLMLGYLLIPGGVLLFYVIHEVRPPRALVVSEQGLAVVARSFWTGRPAQIVTLLPRVALHSPSPSGSVTLDLGPERITLPRQEFDIAASASAAPAGWS